MRGYTEEDYKKHSQRLFEVMTKAIQKDGGPSQPQRERLLEAMKKMVQRDESGGGDDCTPQLTGLQ